MQRLCICHIITQLELGGAQQNTLYTVSHLDRRRFAPVLIAGPGGALDADARALGDVPLVTLDTLARPVHPRRDLVALGRLGQVLRELPRPLVVHTHSSKAGVLGRLAARWAKADAVVHSVHGFAFFAGQDRLVHRAYVSAEHLMAPFADAYICVSRADQARGEDLGLFGAAAVRLIRSGIDVDSFRFDLAARQRVRSALGVSATTPVVGTVANFKPQKAPLVFVDVAAEVLRRTPDAHFVYVGDGPLRPQVEAALSDRGIADRVHLLGWQRDVAAYMSAFDVFLLTSAHEGFPRTVVQAAACGCPVVATRTGGTDEVLSPDRLAAPGDVAVLAAHVLALLPVPSARATRDPIPAWLAEFSASGMVRAQERLYRELVEGR